MKIGSCEVAEMLTAESFCSCITVSVFLFFVFFYEAFLSFELNAISEERNVGIKDYYLFFSSWPSDNFMLTLKSFVES